ncbi:mucin-3B-like [Monodon monoceros]|uniref:mucin-3B-like n=1 Tax=Monodon monoceros TaxID=40151 RepID=UPI0010F9591F|nr:mucin-3B-like [Monodon monoceros]
MVSTFQTSTAITQAPTSNDILTTPTTQVVSVATEASTELGTRKTTPLNTMSSTKATLTSYCDHDQNRNKTSNGHFNMYHLENSSIDQRLNNKNNQDLYHKYSNNTHITSTTEVAQSGTKSVATARTSITALSTSSVSPSTPLPELITSTSAISTPFSTIISSSIPEITISSLSSISTSSPVSMTSKSFPTSSHVYSTDITGSSVTAFPTFSSSETARTSLTTSPQNGSSRLTQTTTMLTLSSTTQCPESVSVTIVSASPTTPCIEVGPNPEVTSTPTIPLSVFTSTTERATCPSSTTRTTVFPAKTDTSTSVFETDPADMTDVPSPVSTGTTPINTDFTSTQRPTSGTWISTNFVTTPRVPGSTSLPVTVKPSGSFSTTVMTSSKRTHSTSPITSTPGIPAATTKTLSTLTSPRTTLTTTQMTTQSRLTITPGTCDNGGTWMQSHCSCPSTFSGSHCEFAVEHIDVDKVDAEVGMEVSVDKKFSPDLNDNTSKAYRDFTDTFRNQMKKVYQNVEGFKEVVILSLRNGSIVVDYLVQLKLPFSLQLESEYEKVKVALKEELQTVSQNSSCGKDQVLCFKPDSIKVNNSTRTELSREAICRRVAAVGYEDFYFPWLKENKLQCVTKCTAGVDGAIDCRQGQCVLQRSGPYCRCFSTDTHWFSGSRCEVTVSWRALVGGLAGTAALLLLLLLGVLSVFVARSWRRRGQGGGLSWDDSKWFETCDESTVKTFSNLGFENDRTSKDENFYVALENVDTNMTLHFHKPEVNLTSL